MAFEIAVAQELVPARRLSRKPFVVSIHGTAIYVSDWWAVLPRACQHRFVSLPRTGKHDPLHDSRKSRAECLLYSKPDPRFTQQSFQCFHSLRTARNSPGRLWDSSLRRAESSSGLGHLLHAQENQVQPDRGRAFRPGVFEYRHPAKL